MITKEQLERFAELVNARWPECSSVHWGASDPGDFFISVHAANKWRDYHSHDERGDTKPREDIHNASFIIWCLDRLEELWRTHWAEQVSNLRHGIDLIGAVAGDSEYCVHVIVYPESDAWISHKVYPAGATRAEACFLALLAALEVEEVKG